MALFISVGHPFFSAPPSIRFLHPHKHGFLHFHISYLFMIIHSIICDSCRAFISNDAFKCGVEEVGMGCSFSNRGQNHCKEIQKSSLSTSLTLSDSPSPPFHVHTHSSPLQAPLWDLLFFSASGFCFPPSCY